MERAVGIVVYGMDSTDDVRAVSPNITGYFGRLTGTRGVDEGTFSGAFALNGASNLSHGGQDSATNARNSDFDASRCSVIYGETETVQPFALRGLACIKI